MLSNLNAGSSREDIQLIRELKETCVNMKPTLTYMISSSNKSSKESSNLKIIRVRLSGISCTRVHEHYFIYHSRIVRS